MWVTRLRYPSYPRAARPRKPQPASSLRARNGAARYCNTQGSNAHITGERQVLYAWHPWSDGIVTVHSIIDKGTGPVARCCLAGEAAGLPLEIPIWMFDRMACAAARFEDDPQVGITSLSALRALLTEVTAGDHLESRLPSTDLILGADLMSCDRNQGDGHASSSHEASPVRSVRSVRQCQGDDDAGLAGASSTDAPEDHRADGAIAGGTRPGATERFRRRQPSPCRGER